MDGIGAGIEGGINDFTDVKVGLFQGAITEWTGLVGHAAMQSVGVVIGKDRHRSDMQLPQSLDDADGNLASVGNEYFMYSSTIHCFKKEDGHNDRPLRF
jgi:hypothetical protein